MRFLLATCVAFSLSYVAPSYAGTLVDWCDTNKPMLASYLSGALDYSAAIQMMDAQVGRSIAPTICIPQNTSIDAVSDAFCKYAKSNKERQSWPSGLLTHVALSKSFPCQ